MATASNKTTITTAKIMTGMDGLPGFFGAGDWEPGAGAPAGDGGTGGWPGCVPAGPGTGPTGGATGGWPTGGTGTGGGVGAAAGPSGDKFGMSSPSAGAGALPSAGGGVTGAGLTGAGGCCGGGVGVPAGLSCGGFVGFSGSITLFPTISLMLTLLPILTWFKLWRNALHLLGPVPRQRAALMWTIAARQ